MNMNLNISELAGMKPIVYIFNKCFENNKISYNFSYDKRFISI